MFIHIIQEIGDIHVERANTELARKSGLVLPMKLIILPP